MLKRSDESFVIFVESGVTKSKDRQHRGMETKGLNLVDLEL